MTHPSTLCVKMHTRTFLLRVLDYEQTWLVEGLATNNKKTVAKYSNQFIEYKVTQSRNPPSKSLTTNIQVN